MVFSLIGLSVHLSSQLRCNSCKLGIGKDNSRPNYFLLNKNWRMCSALIERILQFYIQFTRFKASKSVPIIFCIHLLLFLQSLCSSVSHKSLTPLGAPSLRGLGRLLFLPYLRSRVLFTPPFLWRRARGEAFLLFPSWIIH